LDSGQPARQYAAHGAGPPPGRERKACLSVRGRGYVTELIRHAKLLANAPSPRPSSVLIKTKRLSATQSNLQQDGAMAPRLHRIPVDVPSFRAIMRDRVENIT